MKRVKNSEYGPLPFEWNIEEIQNIADNEVANSFIDGDWIESKYLEEEGIRLIQTGNIGLGSFKEKKVKKFISPESYEELKCKEVKENDILICRLADPIGRACIVPNLGTKNITSVDIVILRPDGKKYDTQFINYLLNSNKTLAKVQSFSSGTTRQRISRKNLGRVRIPVPPLDEQQKIASVLSSVDETIEKTEQIIEQTHYVKNGVLKKLMSRGIGHTKFKDSEVGRIPLNWEVKNLDELSIKILGGGTPSRKKSEYYNGEIPWVTVKDLGDKLEIHKSLEYITELGLQNSAAKIIPKNNLLISTRMAVGKILKNRVDVSINQDMKGIIVDKSKITVDFFLYAYINKKSNIERMGTGTTVKGVRLETLKKINFAIPPLNEQEQVTNIVNELESKIGNEKRNLKSLILLKQGLMQQLLTGKVRVPMNENEEVPQ